MKVHCSHCHQGESEEEDIPTAPPPTFAPSKYLCPICGKDCNNGGGLSSHKRAKHPDAKKAKLPPTEDDEEDEDSDSDDSDDDDDSDGSDDDDDDDDSDSDDEEEEEIQVPSFKCRFCDFVARSGAGRDRHERVKHPAEHAQSRATQKK